MVVNGREALGLLERRGLRLVAPGHPHAGTGRLPGRRAIRERERTAGGHLPIIALTARSRKEDRERCLAAGMDEFLDQADPCRRPVGSHRPGRADVVRPTNLRRLDLLDARGSVGRLRGRPDDARENVPVAPAHASRSTLPRSERLCMTRTPRAYARRLTNSAACSRRSRRPPAITRPTWKNLRPAHSLTKLSESLDSSKRPPGNFWSGWRACRSRTCGTKQS